MISIRLTLSLASRRVATTAGRALSTTPGIGLGKTSTGLVGLEVDHEAIPKIIDLNQSLLDKMANSDMPESAQYRINVTKIANYRIQVCNENLHDPEKVEELIACGQVEELVEQAKDEHDVLDMYLNKRYWEIVGSVDNVEPEVEIDPEFSETDTEESAKQSS